MRHRKKKKYHIPSQKKTLFLRNLATSVLLYEQIETTLSQAKAVIPTISRAIRIGKKQEDPVQKRRELIKLLGNKLAAEKVFKVFNERFKDRSSGFLKIIRLKRRRGDNALLVKLQFV